MAKFFTYLYKNNLFDNWAPALDWYLSTRRFIKWQNNDFEKLSENILMIKNFPAKCNYDDESKLKFPLKTPKNYCVYIAKNKRNKKTNFAKDIVRHIRNAFAHGRIKFFNKNNKVYLELKDFFDETEKIQSAYIYLKLKIYLEIYNEFLKINNNIKRLKK